MSKSGLDDPILIRLIDNGVLVKTGLGWIHFASWDGPGGASECIAKRFEALKRERAATPK